MAPKEFRYRIHLNKDSRFMEYLPHHTMVCAYEGTIKADTPGEALNSIFHTFNMAHPADYRNRSLSVGDVVELPGQTPTYFACASVGWDAISHTKGIISFEGCKSCGGYGKQRVEATVITPTSTYKEKPVFMTCLWCHGKGYQTAEEAAKQQRFNDAWCQCPGECDDTYYPEAQYASCNRCGKLTQTG